MCVSPRFFKHPVIQDRPQSLLDHLFFFIKDLHFKKFSFWNNVNTCQKIVSDNFRKNHKICTNVSSGSPLSKEEHSIWIHEPGPSGRGAVSPVPCQCRP